MTRRKAAAASTAQAKAPAPANEAVNEAANDAPSNGRVIGGTSLPEPGFEDHDDIQDVGDAFPDEELPDDPRIARQVAGLEAEQTALAHASPEVHVHLSNTERLARQRAAFPGSVSTPRAARRRITAELVKAETKLVHLERRRQDSFDLHEQTWHAKRLALIRSFPRDVLAALHAMNVIEDEDVDELEGLEVGS